MSQEPTARPLVRALLIGVLAGARSFTPLGALALRQGRGPVRGTWDGWPVLRSPAGRAALGVAAVGELVGDKLPATPSRISPGPLIGRAGTGAIAGLAIGSRSEQRAVRIGSAALGAVGGVLGSYAGSLARSAAGRATGLPDAVLALVEDAVAVGGSIILVTDA